jgi:hypothetical protein
MTHKTPICARSDLAIHKSRNTLHVRIRVSNSYTPTDSKRISLNIERCNIVVKLGMKTKWVRFVLGLGLSCRVVRLRRNPG